MLLSVHHLHRVVNFGVRSVIIGSTYKICHEDWDHDVPNSCSAAEVAIVAVMNNTSVRESRLIDLNTILDSCVCSCLEFNLVSYTNKVAIGK